MNPDGYTAEGKELTVGFSGGVCADYKATATESGAQVKVTVTETPWPDKICIMIAKEYHKTVQLTSRWAAGRWSARTASRSRWRSPGRGFRRPSSG